MNKRGVIFLIINIIFFVIFSIVSASAANLPTVGGDTDNWGTILNNYLQTEHGANGTHTNITAASLNVSNFFFVNGSNVGIGTMNSIDKLMINGSLRVQNSLGSLALYINDSTGNVGIGTASPNGALAVVAGSDTWSGNFFGVSSGNQVRLGTYLGVATIGANNNAGNAWANLSLNPGGGNVGIGTASPSQKLEVAGNINITGGAYTIYGLSGIPGGGIGNVLTGWYSDANNLAARYPGSNGAFYIQNASAGVTYFRSGASAGGTSIDVGNLLVPNGNVGIGTANPTSKLNVAGNVNITGNLTLGAGIISFNSSSNSYIYYNGSDWNTLGAGSAAGNGTFISSINLSGNLVTANQTFTKITWQTPETDTLSEFNSSSDFKPKNTGTYLICTSMVAPSFLGGGQEIDIYINGVRNQAVVGNEGSTVSGCTAKKLNAGDIMSLYIYQSQGSITYTPNSLWDWIKIASLPPSVGSSGTGLSNYSNFSNYTSYWGNNINSTNSTQFENINGMLHIVESWFATAWNNLFRNWNNQNLNTTNSPTFVNLTLTGNLSIAGGGYISYNSTGSQYVYYNGSSWLPFGSGSGTGTGGSIIASGNNSNGYYIQFADGTMIEWGNFSAINHSSTAQSVYYGVGLPVTFPIAFTGNVPVVNIKPDYNNDGVFSIIPQGFGNLNLTSFTPMAWASTYGLTGSNNSWTAIGRWTNLNLGTGSGGTGGIVNTITNSNGTCTQYSNGIMECYANNYTLGNISITNPIGATLYYSNTQSWNYPASFISPPSVQARTDQMNTGGTLIWPVIGASQSAGNTFVLFYVAASNSVSSNVSLDLYAIGQWTNSTNINTPDVSTWALNSNGDIVQVNTSRKVGIGTLSPAVTLEVDGMSSTGGGIRLQSNASAASLGMDYGFISSISNLHMSQNAYWNGTSWNSIIANFSTNIIQTASSTTASAFYVGVNSSAINSSNQPFNWNYIFTILNNGNVGIGTISPAYPLDVNGIIRSNGSSALLIFNDRSTNQNWGWYGQSGVARLYNGSTDLMAINSSTGNIGIGTATPSQKLEVAGNINATGIGGNFLHVQDQQPSGISENASATAKWLNRTLNTVLTNEISGASLSSNNISITLPAGTYFVQATSPTGEEQSLQIASQARIFDITHNIPLLNGTTTYGQVATGSYVLIQNAVNGRFTLTSTSDISLQQWMGAVPTAGGWGQDTALASGNIYSNVMIWKTA